MGIKVVKNNVIENPFSHVRRFSIKHSGCQEKNTNNGGSNVKRNSKLDDMTDKVYKLTGTDFKNLYQKSKNYNTESLKCPNMEHKKVLKPDNMVRIENLEKYVMF